MVVGLALSDGPIHLEPGNYEFVIMDGDHDIITLLDPDSPPDGLLAQIPLAYADEVTRR
jgi:hypothetical protein